MISLVIFQSCDSTTDDSVFKNEMLSFHQSFETVSTDVQHLNDQFKKMPKPELPQPLDVFSNNEWQYAVGSPLERLNVEVSNLPQKMQPVSVRHRVLEPDSPLWYVKDQSFPGAVTLRVSADDGSQIWYGRERIPLYRGRYFNVPASDDSQELIIRVLNNAMWGGLNSINAYDQQEFMEYEQYRRLNRRIEVLVEKTSQVVNLPEESVSLIQRAINEPVETHISNAEDALSDYPYFVTPPYLQQTDSNELSILWETDISTKHELVWGSDPGQLNYSTKSDSTSIIHEAELSNLEPGKIYYYQIKQRESTSKVYPFKLPSDSTHFQFAIWGDSQSGWDTFDQVVHTMQAYPIEFAIGVGDLVDQAWRPLQYSHLLNSLHPIIAHIPVYLVPGNHDYDGFYDSMEAKEYHRYLRNGHEAPRTYYSWSNGNSAFIALDPHNTFPVGLDEKSEQYKWMVDEFKKPFWKEATWHFIVLHHPPYAQGWSGYHGEISVREALEPLIEEHEIDFVVAGHSHAYERLIKKYENQTTYYIVTGGAGGNLDDYPVSDYPEMDKLTFDYHYTHWHVKGDTILFKAIDNDRKLIDQLTITK